MPLGDAASNRQSQARPFRLLRRGAKEPIEYARLSTRRKRRPYVADFDDEATVLSLDRTSVVRPAACIEPRCR